MNRWWTMLWWVLLLLLPMVPVVIFYSVFSDQNYFELEDTAKGIIAAGPIAAYIAIVGLGIRAYKSVSAKEPKLNDLEERLVGSTWTFTSESRNANKRKGSFRVSSPVEGELQLEGDFQMTDGKPAGDWDSTMVRCTDGRLQVVYDLTDTDAEGKDRKSTGMISLHAKGNSRDEMSGKWVLIGRDDASGEMSCRKVKG